MPLAPKAPHLTVPEQLRELQRAQLPAGADVLECRSSVTQEGQRRIYRLSTTVLTDAGELVELVSSATFDLGQTTVPRRFDWSTHQRPAQLPVC